jgi:hypothetical protein
MPVTLSRRPQITQVAEITELNCYNHYFVEERYATPRIHAQAY